MAYIDLAASTRMGPAAALAGLVIPAEDPAFTPLEWSVVAIARGDRLASILPESRLAALARMIFGLARQNGLACERLEALRRIAVLSWLHGYNIASSELEEFFSAGFSIDQYDVLLAHICAERAQPARSGRR